ncbi:hypothetical protein ACRAVF_06765 [Bradyrhizobium oligotrophicum S58]
MKSLRLMACSALLLPSVALAQQQIPTGSLPPDIAAAIKAAPLTQTLIPISGEEKFAQQIIKADEISFAAGAKLTLTGLNYPYIVVAAQRIKFANPDTYSIIQRDPQAVAAVGSDGPAGPNGADNPGETNRTGNPGYPGGPGGPAVAGQTRQLPDVYLVAGELSDPKGPIPAGLLNLVLLFRGIDGGDGGTGGKAATAAGPETARRGPRACSTARRVAAPAGREALPVPEDAAVTPALGDKAPISSSSRPDLPTKS